jgi:hypothetical protein
MSQHLSRIRRLSLVVAIAPLVGAASAGAKPPLRGESGQSEQLTTVRGTVAQYMMNPRGDVDGLLLEDNTVVRFPPHLGAQLVQLAAGGDHVVVTGFNVMSGIVRAQTIVNEATQRSIVDTPPIPGAPPAEATPQQPMSASGTIRVLTHAPRGEVDGAVLKDGTIIHFPSWAGASFSALLGEDKPLAAAGMGVTYSYGRSMEATYLGTSPRDLQPVAPPPPR